MIKNVTHVRSKEGRITNLKVDGYDRSLEYCINEIENEIHHQTSPPKGHGARIQVILKENGEKHLRTEADGTEKNNLGGLPTF